MDKKTPPPKTKFHQKKISDELDKLQLSSWNLELLFSVVALVIVDEGRGAVPELMKFVGNIFNEEAISTFVIGGAVFSFKLGLNILFVSLLIHIGFRGFWIALIGLRYVSGQIDVPSLNYSKRFEKRALAGAGYDQYIERVEKICSVVYAFIFLVLFLLLSFFMSFATISLIGYLTGLIIDEDNILYLIISFITFIPFVIYFIDTLTFGWLQRIKRPAFIGKVYSPLHKVMQYATLSILYRPLLHNFMDHKYSRRLAFSVVPILLVVFFVNFIGFQPTTFWPSYLALTQLKNDGKLFHQRYFDDEGEAHRTTEFIHFPSRYINGNIIELSLKYSPWMEGAFKKVYPEFAKNGNEPGFRLSLPDLKNDIAYSQFIDRYTSMFTISVNDSIYKELDFMLEVDNNIKELNFITTIDVSHLPYGFVHVKAEYPYMDSLEDSLTTKVIKIPLIKR